MLSCLVRGASLRLVLCCSPLRHRDAAHVHRRPPSEVLSDQFAISQRIERELQAVTRQADTAHHFFVRAQRLALVVLHEDPLEAEFDVAMLDARQMTRRTRDAAACVRGLGALAPPQCVVRRRFIGARVLVVMTADACFDSGGMTDGSAKLVAKR